MSKQEVDLLLSL